MLGGILGGAGGLFGGLGGRKEARSYSKTGKKITEQALGELTPEAMQGLMQMFFQQFQGLQNPAMQLAQQSLKAGAGRAGLTGSGLTRQLQAGIPGQFANQALMQALMSALPIAGQRANIRARQPFKTGPSGYSILGNAFSGAAPFIGGK